MARTVCCSWCDCEILAAATRREQTLRKRQGRPGSAFEGPRTAAGGDGAESLQGGRREGGQEGEGVQDAAGCEFDRAVRQKIFTLKFPFHQNIVAFILFLILTLFPQAEGLCCTFLLCSHQLMY